MRFGDARSTERANIVIVDVVGAEKKMFRGSSFNFGVNSS